MASEFVFHIRNAPPEDMAAVLTTLDSYAGLESVAEIVKQAEGLGFRIRDRQRLEALTTARDLGMVIPEKNILTDTGRMLARLEMNKPELFTDVVHILQYTLWDHRQLKANCFSWSYRTVCQMLWHSGTATLASRRDMASEIEAHAREFFARPDIVFSPKSIGGALLWIADLDPPVLFENDKLFARRTFCSPELLLLGLDLLYRIDEIDYGANLLVSDERRDAVCQACMLEPDGFDRVLDYAVAQFSYLKKGLGGGWGRYVTLQRPPKLEEFA